MYGHWWSNSSALNGFSHSKWLYSQTHISMPDVQKLPRPMKLFQSPVLWGRKTMAGCWGFSHDLRYIGLQNQTMQNQASLWAPSKWGLHIHVFHLIYGRMKLTNSCSCKLSINDTKYNSIHISHRSLWTSQRK